MVSNSSEPLIPTNVSLPVNKRTNNDDYSVILVWSGSSETSVVFCSHIPWQQRKIVAEATLLGGGEKFQFFIHKM